MFERSHFAECERALERLTPECRVLVEIIPLIGILMYLSQNVRVG
jgi:hypothetical protein